MEYSSFNKEFPIEYECSGEQRLCMAVIIQAIKDIHYSSRKRKSLGNKLPQRADKEAIKWVNSNNNSPFSFIWCLEHAFPELFDRLDLKLLRRIFLSKPLLCGSEDLHHSKYSSGRKSLSLYIK